MNRYNLNPQILNYEFKCINGLNCQVKQTNAPFTDVQEQSVAVILDYLLKDGTLALNWSLGTDLQLLTCG